MIQDALRRFAFLYGLLPIATMTLGSGALAGDRMIRSKQPDRQTYQPPVITKGKVQSVKSPLPQEPDGAPSTDGLVDAPLDEVAVAVAQEPALDTATVRAPAYDATGELEPVQPSLPAPVVLSADAAYDASRTAPVQTVGYEQADRYRNQAPPTSAGHIATCSCESCSGGAVSAPMPPSLPYQPHGSGYVASEVMYDGGCDAAACCDSPFCDGSGCDSIGCSGLGRFAPASDQWFGSIELLLMFRKGDSIPALASDGPLDDTTTQVFAGGETIYQDMTAGGRLSIGAWLDNCKDRHLVARGWFAGEQTFDFNANQNTHPTLVRPFFNVTDGTTPTDDVRIIATPGEASGSLSIHGDSNTFGADVSIRQLWYKRYGGTVDLLYGYQYMGLNESLRIADSATSLVDGVRPIGSILATADSFDVENDFHGGQIGVATHYREGCWSFSSLAKIGFGSIRRRAVLSGSTFTSIDGNNATNPNGLLVRSTNAGTHSDDTFGWAPELDFTLGWQQYPCFDVTFGYHLMAMTDALRVGDVIDPTLSSNLVDDPVGAQRPTAVFRDGTFYVQGIHFGLSYIY